MSEPVTPAAAERRAELRALRDALDRCVPVASACVLDEPAPTHLSVVLRPEFAWRGYALTDPVNDSAFGVTRVQPQGVREQLVVRIE